jgi:hypothetical protein
LFWRVLVVSLACGGSLLADELDAILRRFRSEDFNSREMAESDLDALRLDDALIGRIASAATSDFPDHWTWTSVNAELIGRLRRESSESVVPALLMAYDELRGRRKARETALQVLIERRSERGRAAALELLSRPDSRDVDLCEALRPLYRDPQEARLYFPRLIEISPWLENRVAIFDLTFELLEKGLLDRAANSKAFGMLIERMDTLVRHRGEYLSEVYGALPVRVVSWEERKRLPELARRGHDELEILLDLSAHLESPAVDELLAEATKLKAPTLQIYAVGAQARRGTRPDPVLLKTLAAKPSERALLWRVLERSRQLQLFPSEFKTQSYIAEARMVSWLEFGTELGMTPTRVELVRTVEFEKPGTPGKLRAYFYKFPGWDGEQGEWYLGWAGSFLADDGALETDGSTFSHFTKFGEKDLELQVAEAIEALKARESAPAKK